MHHGGTRRGRPLGRHRQPFCGKCCGEHTKAGNAKQKRAQRRSERQSLKQDTRGTDNEAK